MSTWGELIHPVGFSGVFTVDNLQPNTGPDTIYTYDGWALNDLLLRRRGPLNLNS